MSHQWGHFRYQYLSVRLRFRLLKMDILHMWNRLIFCPLHGHKWKPWRCMVDICVRCGKQRVSPDSWKFISYVEPHRTYGAFTKKH